MITVEKLYHSYNKDEQYQVNDVSFTIAQGEIFGFLGPNGAGKSTTQKILTGLLPLQRGQVVIAGEEIRQAGRHIFNQIGVSFEQPNVYKKLTGLENLNFHRGLYDVETADPLLLLRHFGLEEAANKRVSTYSKGMQQRLVLARSLLNQPRIWFLDEPTAGLDPNSAQQVRQLIRQKQNEGVTIFLTTHDMHVADSLCDRIAFLDEGRIVALDTPRSLKLKHGKQSLQVEYRLNGRTDTLYLNQSDSQDRQRLLQLMESGQVETVHSQEATLEAVFIDLTGRGLG
ncbi:MAG: ABC transporter ATP-binding protein [Chloroflexota bacterium]|jgi:fluoroquinolone transport system ATP-binding protein